LHRPVEPAALIGQMECDRLSASVRAKAYSHRIYVFGSVLIM
jgi:hypothetical protein